MSPIALIFLLACGPEGTDTAHDEDPGVHACEQLDAAGTGIDAGASIDEATAIEPSEQPYEVTLASDSSTWLRIEVDQEEELLLFVDLADVVLDLLHEQSPEGVADAGANEHCPDDLPAHFHLDLHEPGTYQLELAPSAADSLWLMLLESGEHEHE